jgi:Tfp pilus assembly protein PilO
MPKTLTIRRFNLKRSGTKRTTVSQEIKKSKEMSRVFFAVIIVIMSLAYVFQMSGIATNGYEVEKYENKLVDLKRENQKIMIKLADLEAMSNIENSNNGLVAIERNNISYIASSSGAVAMRK